MQCGLLVAFGLCALLTTSTMCYFYVFSTVHSLRHPHFNLWNVALSPRRQRLQPQLAAAVALFIAQLSWATDVSTATTRANSEKTTRSWPTTPRKRYAWRRRRSRRHCAGLSIRRRYIGVCFSRKVTRCRRFSLKRRFLLLGRCPATVLLRWRSWRRGFAGIICMGRGNLSTLTTLVWSILGEWYLFAAFWKECFPTFQWLKCRLALLALAILFNFTVTAAWKFSTTACLIIDLNAFSLAPLNNKTFYWSIH